MYRPFFSSFLLYSPTPCVPSVFVHTDFSASFSPDYRCNASEAWERIANSSIFDQTAETKGNFARTRLLTDSSGKRNPYTSISIDSSTVVLLLAFLADWFPPGGDESFPTIFEYRSTLRSLCNFFSRCLCWRECDSWVSFCTARGKI